MKGNLPARCFPQSFFEKDEVISSRVIIGGTVMRGFKVLVVGSALSLAAGVGCSFDDRGAGPGDPGEIGGRTGHLPPQGGRIGSGWDGSVPSDDANCGVAMAGLQMLPPEILI